MSNAFNNATKLRGLPATPISESALASTTPDTLGGIYELSDGDNRGAKLTWAVPENGVSPTWCWWAWPQSIYGE